MISQHIDDFDFNSILVYLFVVGLRTMTSEVTKIVLEWVLGQFFCLACEIMNYAMHKVLISE